MARHMSLYGSVIMAVLVLVSGTGLSAVMMPNASFEESPVDGVLPGWPSPYGGVPFGGPEVRLSNEKAVDGDYSVRIEDRNPNGGYGLRIMHIPVVPGREYEASVRAFREEGAAQLYLEFWNEKGQRIYVEIGSAGAMWTWDRITLRGKAPPDAATLTLLLYSHVANVGVAYYDAVELRELEPEELPARREGVLWDVPAWIEPDMDLAHPRVQYTRESLEKAKAKLAANVRWARLVYDDLIRQADGFQFTPEQIHEYMPPQYAYFKYTDTMMPCPDGSPMTASWHNPGEVSCGLELFPNETHPDDGRGWTDEKGQTHYFVARWNGFVVEQFSRSLLPLAFAYALSDDEAYAEKAAAILDGLATIYPTTIEGPLDYPGLRPGYEGGRLERPYYQTARLLLNYTTAADLIWNSPVMDERSPTNPALTVRENITYNLLLNGADYCYREANRTGYINALHNGTADYNKAILAVGSMFGIERYIEWALNGPTSFDKMISNNIDRDGLYYETTTGYTDVVRTLYLQIAEMFYSLRTPKYPQGINYYDDPRFQALYVDSRERLFVAGRLPLYGDSSVDSGGPGKVMSDRALPELLQFAVRSSDPQDRLRFWALINDATNRMPIFAYNNTWGLFNVDEVPTDIPEVVWEWPATEVLGGNGIALLRSGDDRGVFMRYGATLNHGQRDELAINLYAGGRELGYDPGYGMAHYRRGWTHETVSHLAAVVNETGQQGSGGSLIFATGAPGFAAVEASDPGAYAHQGVSVYRRLVALVDSDPKTSYVVDLFRVLGGNVRDYSFHSWSTEFSTEGLEFGPKEPGSLGNPDYSWHNQIGVDEKIIPYRHQGFYWSPPPGNGYGFLGNPRRASGDTAWSATWRAADRRVKLMMLPEKDREIIVADGPSLMNFTPYLLARERGDKPSQFVSVIDIGPGEFRVKRIEALPIVRQPDGAFKPVAMAVTLDEENGVQDIFLSGISGPFEARRDDASYATDAQLAFVRWSGDELTGIHVTLGSFVRGGRFSLDGFPAAYQGQVVDIDYDQGSLLIAPEGEWSFALADQYVLITAPEYPVNSAYRIRQAEKEGDYVRLQLFPTSLELGRGYVPTEPKDDLIPNMTNLPYTGLIYRVTPNDRFQGKEVVNEKGARTVIKQVEGAAALRVDDTTGFAAEDNITIYDIKIGDTVSIPVSVHLIKVDDLSYQLESPTSVWLSIEGQDDAEIYVEKDGRYVPAVTEKRGSSTWFHIPPGRVLLQRTARVVGPLEMKVDEANPQIIVRLEELAVAPPVSGATVYGYLEEARLEFDEIEAGIYAVGVPAGTPAGVYDFRVEAADERLSFYPLEARLEVDTTWRVTYPDRTQVPLGVPFRLELPVQGVDKDRLRIQGATESDPVSIEWLADDLVGINLPVINREQDLRLQLAHVDGFTREIEIRLYPGGGRIMPLVSEMRVKAGQEVEIQVRFMVGDTVLKGDAIPSGQAFYGLMSWSEFSDPDGDGIATATVRLGPGEHTVHLLADGCTEAQVKIIAEP
ncbi:MAG: hypothetical protein GX162_03430 [Firmicutes bacterium]|nr:hypothetical protein [Bacillota bacterium]